MWIAPGHAVGAVCEGAALRLGDVAIEQEVDPVGQPLDGGSVPLRVLGACYGTESILVGDLMLAHLFALCRRA